MKGFSLLLILILLPASLVAQDAPPGNFNQRNFKDSGWGLGYGYDEELDENDKEKEAAARKAEEARKAEKQKEEQNRNNDFFGEKINALEKEVELDDAM